MLLRPSSLEELDQLKIASARPESCKTRIVVIFRYVILCVVFIPAILALFVGPPLHQNFTAEFEPLVWLIILRASVRIFMSTTCAPLLSSEDVDEANLPL